MSGALWHFFWTEADWGAAPAPTPAPTPAPDPGSGGGHGKGKGKGGAKKREYVPANEDYWYEREKYLESLQPIMRKEIPPAPPPRELNLAIPPAPPPLTAFESLPRLTEERQVLIDLLPTIQEMPRLKAQAARLNALNAAIRALRAERARKDRQARIRLQKKKAAVIAALDLLKQLQRYI